MAVAATLATQHVREPKAWSLYFTEEEYSENDRRAQLIKELVLHFRASKNREALLSRTKFPQEGSCVCVVAADGLLEACGSGDLEAAIECQPLEALACIAAAAYEVIFSPVAQDKASSRVAEAPCKVTVQLTDYSTSLTSVRLLKASCISKLVTLRGTVVRISTVKPLIQQMNFACNKCSATHACHFPDGRYAPPTACIDGCKSRQFVPLRATAHCIDWQKIRLQELDKSEDGSMPRTIEVDLTDDLVGSCRAGDVVTVLGIVKVINTETETGARKTKDANCLFLLYLEAISVTFGRLMQRLEPVTPQHEDRDQLIPAYRPAGMPEFSNRDLRFIIKFTEEYEGEQLRHLVHALCPGIWGQEMVKAGLLLALFGGVSAAVTPYSHVTPIRGDIHVLLCGDPGLGKSQLLQAVAAVAPRAVYVCGGSSSSAGLTVSVVKDAVSGEHVIEAGALVLADGGVCCIDEFDKIPSEHKTLLGAMEQQEVAVAKAGMCAALPARTSILAAANPHGGTWQPSKTMQENLRLSPGLLSRFDLAFVMLDAPDQQHDAYLSEQVLSKLAGRGDRASSAKRQTLSQQASRSFSSSAHQGSSQQRLPLREALQIYSDDDAEPPPPQLLKTYIAYARMHCHPELSTEAKQVLKAFWLELRAKAPGCEGEAVTMRQLESLIRLAEARTRCDLRPTVTEADAQDVVELMQACVWDDYLANSSVSNFQRGGAKGKKAEAARFLAALRRQGEARGNAVFQVSELYSIADSLDLAVPDMHAFIEELNYAGELLKKGGQMYSVSGCKAVSVSHQSTGNSRSTNTMASDAHCFV